MKQFQRLLVPVYYWETYESLKLTLTYYENASRHSAHDVRVCECERVSVWVCLSVCACVHVCVWECIHLGELEFMWLYTYVIMCLCVYLCVCVYIDNHLYWAQIFSSTILRHSNAYNDTIRALFNIDTIRALLLVYILWVYILWGKLGAWDYILYVCMYACMHVCGTIVCVLKYFTVFNSVIVRELLSLCVHARVFVCVHAYLF